MEHFDVFYLLIHVISWITEACTLQMFILLHVQLLVLVFQIFTIQILFGQP